MSSERLSRILWRGKVYSCGVRHPELVTRTPHGRFCSFGYSALLHGPQQLIRALRDGLRQQSVPLVEVV